MHWRGRHSTAVLSLVFVVTLVAYILVRPAPQPRPVQAVITTPATIPRTTVAPVTTTTTSSTTTVAPRAP